MPFEYAAFLSYRHSATGLGAWVHHFHGILEAKIRERIPKGVFFDQIAFRNGGNKGEVANIRK